MCVMAAEWSRESALCLTDDLVTDERQYVLSQKALDLDEADPVGAFNAYSCGDAWLHLHAAVSGLVGDSREICAVYEGQSGCVIVGHSGGRLEGGQRLKPRFEDEPVLVLVVEVLKFGEVGRAALSVVRLQSLYECLLGWPECPDGVASRSPWRDGRQGTAYRPTVRRDCAAPSPDGPSPPRSSR